MDLRFPFSLTPGGWVYRKLRAVGLLDPSQTRLARPVLVLGLLAWVPVLVLGALQKMVTGRIDPVLREPSVHVRALVSIPLLIVAGALLRGLWARTLARFSDTQFVDDADQGAFEQLQRTWLRASGSKLGAALAIGLATAGGLCALFGLIGPAGYLDVRSRPDRWSVLRIYYALVTLPLYQYLVVRVFWRWGVWSWFLVRLSKLKLHPTPTHPDRSGGLGYLRDPTSGFAVVMFALSSVVAASFARQILDGKATPQTFLPAVVTLALFALAVALGPLCAFALPLYRARLSGLRQYSWLTLTCSQSFHAQFIDEREGAKLLGRPDSSALIDLFSVYETLAGMRVWLGDRRSLIAVAAAVLVPMLPLIALQIPVDQLLLRIGKALVGGGPS